MTWNQNFLACLLYYDGHVGDVMRNANNNYAGEYCNIMTRVECLHNKADDNLLTHYVQLMTTDATARFVAETSWNNAMPHWHQGKHPSINLKLQQVNVTMNKEEWNCFDIPFPSWIAWFLPDVFFTPQHILQKPNKKDRQVFDGSIWNTPTSTPVKMMTSTKDGVELNCLFGNTFDIIPTQIWNLHIIYPTSSIILHTNDVKSCFWQIKHHPGCAGAFSYVIADKFYLQ